MQTDDLIARLSQDGLPVRRYSVAVPLVSAIVIGLAVTIILMITTLGVRPDLRSALHSASFWTKFTYTLIIALIGLRLLERAGRPGTKSRIPLVLLALPVGALALLAIWQLLQPDMDRHLLIMGHTAKDCTILIASLSVPLLAACLWVLRLMAPTRLHLAGAAAGLLAGSIAATVYAFHCPETAAPFVFLWYSGGVLLSAAVGAVLGPSVLRW